MGAALFLTDQIAQARHLLFHCRITFQSNRQGAKVARDFRRQGQGSLQDNDNERHQRFPPSCSCSCRLPPAPNRGALAFQVNPPVMFVTVGWPGKKGVIGLA